MQDQSPAPAAPPGLRIERATAGETIVGHRLTVGDTTLLVFADQDGTPGFRLGAGFLPDFKGPWIEYAPVDIAPHAAAAEPMASAALPLSCFGSTFVTREDGTAGVTLHFRNTRQAEEWHKAVTARNDAAQAVVQHQPRFPPSWVSADYRRPTLPAAPSDADWKIDHSAGRPILVYKNCSVIEAEDAEYVLRLIASDRAALTHPAPVAAPAHVGDSGFESWFSEKNMAGLGTKQLARDAYAAGMSDPLAAPAPASEAVPDPLLIDSMCTRWRHDFGLQRSADDPLSSGFTDAERDSLRRSMRQLWEEVVGLGFYRPAQAAAAPRPLAFSDAGLSRLAAAVKGGVA